MPRKLFNFALIALAVCWSACAVAIDNPDAPDYVGDFLSRAERFERDIQQTEYTTQDYIAAYAKYERFLDQELDKAYGRLMIHIDEAAQHALKDSQQKWVKFRDAEFEFITLNWTAENFGSAAIISRGDYRTTTIKHRITVLLYYLQNY